MKTYLSGIQPSGLLHLGNFFGAIQQHIALQERPGRHFYFIADFHALTTVRDPEALRRNVFETAVTYLALGLDPQRAVLWRQSDVPEVTEIAWLLSTVTGMGLLERAHSYKDKTARGISASVGLFTYPMLMAADILAYDADFVPVGQDQVQHVEMTQDMAGSFNAAYGDGLLRRPECLLPEAGAAKKVPGLDGQKMSKSYGNDIWIFESGKALKKRVNQIVTDSRPPEEPKDPASLFLFDLLGLFIEPAELADWREKVRRGGPGAPGYGHLKGRLAEAIELRFADARARREELLAHPERVAAVLEAGADQARAQARVVRDRCYQGCGLR
jgi:tryptophanyl-tRNA synthetase